jgi:hypothetical protein
MEMPNTVLAIFTKVFQETILRFVFTIRELRLEEVDEYYAITGSQVS